jgi:hypothetical protein
MRWTFCFKRVSLIQFHYFLWWVSTIIYPGVHVNLERIIIIYPGLSKHCRQTIPKDKWVVIFLSHFLHPLIIMFYEGKKKCNKVWQIFSINSNDDALHTHLTAYLIPSVDSFWCLWWHLIWCLDSDTWSLNINQHRQTTYSRVWTLNSEHKTHTHNPPTTPLLQVPVPNPMKKLYWRRR